MKHTKLWLAMIASLLCCLTASAQEVLTVNMGDWDSFENPDNQKYVFYTPEGGELSFKWYTDPWKWYDQLTVKLDGVTILSKSGVNGSGTYTKKLKEGVHFMTVSYEEYYDDDQAILSNIMVTTNAFLIDGIYYSYTSDSTVCVVDILDQTEVSIPCSVNIGENMYKVSAIAYNAFDKCGSLKKIRIEDGSDVLKFGLNGNRYDLGSSLLETLYMGRNLSYTASSSYGYSPFYGKTSLTFVTISDSVTSIPSYILYGCNNLTSITIPEGVTSIGNNAFDGCTSLKEVIIEDGSTTLSLGYKSYSSGTGEGLFYGCPLDTVYLGRNLQYSYSPFTNNTSLTSLTIGDGVTSIGSSAFLGCSSLTSVVLPNSVTSIGSSAFSGCNEITSITIPESVTSIGNGAFDNCSGLKEVILEDGEEILSLGYNASSQGLFYDCPLETIYLGRTLSYDSSSSYGYSPFYNKASITSVAIGDNVTSIGNYAFYGCNKITSIVIPNSVTFIGSHAFYSCSSLISLTMGNGVTSIGNYAFYYCKKLASITIPSSVTSIGNYAFNGCSSLKEIIFEDGEELLTLGYNYYYSYNSGTGQGLFYDCPLETIYLGRTLSYGSSSSYGYSPFYNKATITSVTIGDNVITIGDYAFSSCSGLTSLTIGKEVASIGYEAFSGCSKITSVVIPESVASIGSYAFHNCSGLTLLTIGDGVTSIGYEAFSGCSKITSVVIPNSVTSIGSHAFYNGSSLTSVLIGNGVTEIGSSSFSGCTALTNLTIGSSVSSIGSKAFAGCNDIENIYALNTKAITCDESIFATDTYNNATLYVPEGREQAYAKATPWSTFYIKTMTTPTESFDVKIGSAGYATLYLDYAVERPRGVEAYYISRVSGDVAVLKAVWDYIPANTGVILRGAKGTYTFTSTDEDVEAISDNLLRGTVVDKDIRAQKNTTYYALGRVDGVVGLYRAELEDGYFFNNANKAYLALTSDTEEDDDSGQLARSLILRFPNGSTTTIAEVMGSDENEEVIYDMQGRRLTEITEHGVYIINGRKVWR